MGDKMGWTVGEKGGDTVRNKMRDNVADQGSR